jgi:pimeloyl-ACP methyl ester carboxylesterase
MGNKMSFSTELERLVSRGVYLPPKVGYARSACQITTTTDNVSIAMYFYSTDEGVMRRFYEYKKLESSKVLLVFSHGNSVDIGGCQDICECLGLSLDVDVLTYDYPGYGHSSQCAATERGLTNAIEAVYKACQDKGVDSNKIVFVGHSLGSVPTLHIASQRDISYLGVVLFAPLASGCRVAAQNKGYIPEAVLCMLDRLLFDNLRNISEANAPVAIIHGTRDTVVSVKQAERLHMEIPNCFKYAPLYINADHNEVLDLTGKHANEVKNYISTFIAYLQNDMGKSSYTDVLL